MTKLNVAQAEFVRGLAEQIREYVRPLHERVKALEAKATPEWKGVYQHGQATSRPTSSPMPVDYGLPGATRWKSRPRKLDLDRQTRKFRSRSAAAADDHKPQRPVMTNEEALAKVMQAFDEIADETLSASIRSFEPLDLTDAELASILAPYIAETAAKRAETERALRSLLARGLASLN